MLMYGTLQIVMRERLGCKGESQLESDWLAEAA